MSVPQTIQAASGVAMISPQHQAWMDALATACVNCVHIQPGRLFCRQRMERIDTLIQAGKPFCPLGKHDGIKVDTTGLVGRPLKRPAEPPRPPWLKRWFGPRVRRLLGWRRRRWLATKPPHWISGALKLLLVCRGHCQPKAAVIATRLNNCIGDDLAHQCEALTRRRLGMRMCGECGCMIRAKVRLASERCPRDKWEASTGNDCRWWKAFRMLGWIEYSPKGCGCGRRSNHQSP